MDTCKLCMAICANIIVHGNKCAVIDVDGVKVVTTQEHTDFPDIETMDEAIRLLRSVTGSGFFVDSSDVGHWGIAAVGSSISTNSKTRS